MGPRKILNIKMTELFKAKKIMKALEILGISEDDLLLIKEIPTILAELNELKHFKEDCIRTARNTNAAEQNQFPTIEQMKKMFTQPIEEFDPNGK